MKYIFLIVFSISILFCVGCNSKQQKNDLANTEESKADASEKNYSPENFSSFVDMFSKDSIFQKSRIFFPISSKYPSDEDEFHTEVIGEEMDTTLIEADDWKTISFYYDSSFAKRQMDAYNQLYDVKNDTAVIKIRGVNNGIYANFYFIKKDSLWYLFDMEDFSN